MANFWPALGFFADPESAPAQSAYYNFAENDNVLRGMRYWSEDRQRAERNALYWDNFFKEVQRGLSNNLIDVSPLHPRGRRAFANEHMNISDIIDDAQYTAAMRSARRLMGAANYGDDNTPAMGIKKRYNDADRALAEKMLIPILNANLPMDDPAVREKAIEIFRSGAGLNETVARTRRFLLDSAGAKDLEEYMSKRSDPIYSRLWRVANSTLPAKMLGDMYGSNYANEGYYNGDSISKYYKTPKTALALATLGSAVKLPEAAGYLLAGPQNPMQRAAITKSLKSLAGPWVSLAGLGMNAHTAIANLSDDDSIKRYALDQVMRGNDPFKFQSKDLAYDLAINMMGLPYGQFVGPGAATSLYSRIKQVASPEYRKKLQQMKQDMVEELLATGKYVRDERGRVLKRPDSLTEHLSNRGGKALSTYLMAGNLAPHLWAAEGLFGAADALVNAYAMRNDMNNGVLDDDFYHQLEADKVHIDGMPRLSSFLSRAKTGLRYGTSWGEAGKALVGGSIDLHKYKVRAKQKAKEISDKVEEGHRKLDAERARRGLAKSSHQLSAEKNSKKTASEPINNNYPAADAAANAEAITKDSLNLKPKARFAHMSRKAYDSFGKPGVAATTSLKLFKPNTLVNVMFGDGSALAKDIAKDKEEARKRYKGTALGILPTELTSSFNDDARAYHIQKKLHKTVKNINKDYAIPLNMAKAALATLIIGSGIKAINNKNKRKRATHNFTAEEIAMLRKEGLI